MRNLMVVGMMIFLAGCTTARPMYSAPGQQRFAIECAPAFPQQCRDRAEKACGGNYSVIVERQGGAYQQHSLIVQCR